MNTRTFKGIKTAVKKGPEVEAGEKIRVSLDLRPATFERLVVLEALLDLDSKAAVLRQAIQLLELLAQRVAKGSRVILKDPDGNESEVLVPTTALFPPTSRYIRCDEKDEDRGWVPSLLAR